MGPFVNRRKKGGPVKFGESTGNFASENGKLEVRIHSLGVMKKSWCINLPKAF